MSDLSYNGNFENPDLLSSTALCGHIQAFKYIFNSYQKRKSGDTKDQYYLAHSAAASGNLKLLKWIIKNTKCDVTDKDPDGLTILHVACLTANLDIVQWLLQYTHLSPVSRTTEGATSLHFAAWSGSMEIVKLMMDTEPRLLNMRMVNGATAAMFATQGGLIDLMEFLLNEGANFGLPTIEGVNCLHLAAQQGLLEVVKWLVENTGLSLNCKDEHGATPIHYAVINNRHNVIKWLMEKEVKLFKERFGEYSLISNNQTDSTKDLEEILRLQRTISVTHTTGFTALDLVEERLKKVFINCDTGISSSDKEEENKGNDQCLISINALLLLQSALSDLRTQYQDLLKQNYSSKGIVSLYNSISQDTQTIESCEDLLYGLPKTQTTSIESTETQTEDSRMKDNILPVPPPPPFPPPLINASNSNNETFPYLNILKDKSRVRRTSTNRKRGSSTGNDVRRSLIDELKEKTTLRSRKKKYCDKEATDTDSVTSSIDSSSISEILKSSEGTITDSSSNIFTLFQKVQESPRDENSKLNQSTITIQPQSLLKEERKVASSQQTPQWMRKIISERGKSPDNILPNTVTKLSVNLSPVMRSTKVIDLVNKFQSNEAGSL